MRDVRPLDRFRSLRVKLGILVAATVTLAALITWAGLYNGLGPTRTLPLAIVLSLLLTQILARGMTSPLRDMIAAARSMAGGDYTARVRASSRDEVGALAGAFNAMAEELESNDAYRRELIANVSHELRTPVAALQANLENLVDGVSEPDPATLAAALAQTERLGKLVSDLLDLSRLEAGAVRLDLADVDVAEVLSDAVDAARLVATGKDIQFDVTVPAGLTVPADVDRLHQVLANLLTNAVRHAPVGSRIGLGAARDGDWVRIDVADEGEGIAAADRERVFRRFERGAIGAGTGGTGLGLAIVRWAVQLHGGTVQIADADTGTLVRVRLPAHPSGARHTTKVPETS